jgi:PAS domain S-box-containing protein/putative nucleotidyltransferase with HDIG domain
MDLEKLRELFQLLLEHLPLGVIVTDTEGDIVFVNQSAEKIRNAKRQNLIGHNIHACHPPSSLEKVDRAIDSLKSSPNYVYHRMVEDHINNKFYTNTYVSLYNQDNLFDGMAVITEDVTEKRESDSKRALFAQMQEETIRNIQTQYHSLLITAMESVSSLLEAKDIYTKDHSKRVAEISTKLYEYKYSMDSEMLDIKAAAFLHDIGKICIPDSILKKNTVLSEEEYSVVKNHSAIAADILEPFDQGHKISTIVKHHHERYDGKGYPDGLSGDAIPLGSRIIAIADSFDAMNSDRPYRNSIPYEKCISEIISQSGKQFDPEWVLIFCEMSRTGSL